MDYFQAAILAVVQGLTEFLPISSSAHLILVPKLLGWQDQGLAFDVAVHVGTLFAVILFLKKEIKQIIPAWLTGWAGFNWNQQGKLGWYVILATIPVGLAGLLGGDFIEANLRHINVIACTTLVFGLLLGFADRKGDNNNIPLENLTWQKSLFVGCAQVLALIPGTSRSGITMTAMLAAGYDRISAAKFSFLLAIPTIVLSGLFKSFDLVSSDTPIAWDVLILGIVVSAVVAFWCMQWFISFIQKVGMKPFVIYRILLAIAIFIILT